MGGSYSFEVKDSPTSPGKKSVESTEISGVDAAKLLEGIEKYVRAGKTQPMASAKCTVSDQDGGILVHDVYQVPAILGGGEHPVYNLYKIDAAASTVEIQFFPTQFFYDKKVVSTTSWIKVLSDPVRVEFWVDAHEARASGPVMQGMLNKLLEYFNLPQTAKSDQASPGKEGNFSALTDPIEGGSELTPDNYFDKFREFLKEKSNVTELPDDTMIEERSGMFGDLVSVGYAKHTINKEEGHLYCHEYGDDENMKDLISVTHVQVHKEPFRVEQWNEPVAQRLTDLPSRGAGHIKLIESFVKGVLKFMEES